jgi:hypothetical protein
MDDIEYDKLYELQDSVLGIVFKTEQEFYLKLLVGFTMLNDILMI